MIAPDDFAWAKAADIPTPQAQAPAPQADRKAEVEAHPLYPVFMSAIEQVMFGKGERHGGASQPFLDQPWMHYAKTHGRGFLTGQAAKKAEEAASTREGPAFVHELYGAMAYLGMAVLWEKGL